MGHQSCCVKQKLRKGLWSPEEDEKLYNYVTRHGVGCWSSVPKLAGLQRCGKSCRLRWINYLRPDLKRGMFSQEEEDLIISLHKSLGNRWAQIATRLPGRTDNEIKNYWNSCLKKKLMSKGIDPNTHQPMPEAKDDQKLVCIDSDSGLKGPSSSITMVFTDAGEMQPSRAYDSLLLPEFQDYCQEEIVRPYVHQGHNPTQGMPNSKTFIETDYSDSSAYLKESSSSSSIVNSHGTFSWGSGSKLEPMFQFPFCSEKKPGLWPEDGPHQDQQVQDSGDFSSFPLASLTEGNLDAFQQMYNKL